MGEHTSKPRVAGEQGRSTLGELIHAAVRGAIEAAVEAELAATLGAGRYERCDSRQGYRNGTKTRTLSGPTGALRLSLPRATVATSAGRQEWRSTSRSMPWPIVILLLRQNTSGPWPTRPAPERGRTSGGLRSNRRAP
jgi:hypothetical protein